MGGGTGREGSGGRRSESLHTERMAAQAVTNPGARLESVPELRKHGV
jgi:hypothetical protein